MKRLLVRFLCSVILVGFPYEQSFGAKFTRKFTPEIIFRKQVGHGDREFAVLSPGQTLTSYRFARSRWRGVVCWSASRKASCFSLRCMRMSTRILIADDDVTILMVLRRLLEKSSGNWQVCGEASNGVGGD